MEEIQMNTGGAVNGAGLPADIDAEKMLLGILMTKPAYFPNVAELITKDDFYLNRHQLIFDAIERLTNEEVEPDPLTVGKKLEDLTQLAEAGGRNYIDSLFNDVTSTAPHYTLARRIQEYSTRRSIIVGAQSIIKKSVEPTDDFELYLDEVEKALLDATSAKSATSMVHVKEVGREFADYIEKVRSSKGGITGLATHFYDFDQLTSGLQPGQLVILAARPGMGKTTFALNMAANVATKVQKPVVIFSLEMSKMELLMRMVCAEGQLNSKKIQKGDIRSDDLEHLMDATKRIFNSPLYIDDTGDLSPRLLRQKIKKLLNKTEIGLIVVDYLQLMSDPESRKQGRQNEVAQISRSLKVLAKDADAPVLALSQMSRNVESRGKDQRPQLSDLRESGAIEQDADMVMFIYREEKVKEEVPPEIKGKAEIILAKHRSGPTGSFMLSFREQMSRFDNIAGSPTPPGGPA